MHGFAGVDAGPIAELIQTDAAIDRRTSGGLLFDPRAARSM